MAAPTMNEQINEHKNEPQDSHTATQPMSAQEIVDLLGLKPLGVEGGLFAQTWQANNDTGRPAGTAIYALFTNEPDSFSAIHRLDATEVWHHYLGDPLHIVLLHPHGTHEVQVLGTNLLDGQRPQLIIEAQTWMGAYVPGPGRYSLIGCTMAPGFVGDAYEGGVQADLLAAYPQAADLIVRLTRPGHEIGTPPES
jgi:uncharacterized protein